MKKPAYSHIFWIRRTVAALDRRQFLGRAMASGMTLMAASTLTPLGRAEEPSAAAI